MLIAQITDLHTGWRSDEPDIVVDTLASVGRAVDHLNGFDPRPDLVLATGDLTRDGAIAEYQALRAELERLAMPACLLVGNHDDRDNLRRVFADHAYLPAEGFLHYAIEELPLRIVALDTLLPGAEGGLLCRERLDWFAATLAAAPERPTLVALHHPPFATGIPFFDAIGLDGGEAMGEIVARHPQIEMVLCGHVHRAISRRWHGTMVSVTPSTSYQYPLDLKPTPDIHPVLEPAVCRICLWQPDAGLVSHLSYIPA